MGAPFTALSVQYAERRTPILSGSSGGFEPLHFRPARMSAIGRKQTFIDSGLFRDLVMRRYPYARERGESMLILTIYKVGIKGGQGSHSINGNRVTRQALGKSRS